MIATEDVVLAEEGAGRLNGYLARPSAGRGSSVVVLHPRSGEPLPSCDG